MATDRVQSFDLEIETTAPRVAGGAGSAKKRTFCLGAMATFMAFVLIAFVMVALGVSFTKADVAATNPQKTQPLWLDKWTVYPGYDGPLSPRGLVLLSDGRKDPKNAIWVRSSKLTGMDPVCTGTVPADVPNACGIHVHEGGNCFSDFQVGGHFWNRDFTEADPWQAAHIAGGEYINQDYAIGTNLEGVRGRVLVLHDSEGRRIACAWIRQPGRPGYPGDTEKPEPKAAAVEF